MFYQKLTSLDQRDHNIASKDTITTSLLTWVGLHSILKYKVFYQSEFLLAAYKCIKQSTKSPQQNYLLQSIRHLTIYFKKQSSPVLRHQKDQVPPFKF